MVAEKTTQKHTSIYAALAAAQNEFGVIYKNSSNPHFKSSYLDLAGLIDATQPILFKNELALTQTTEPAGEKFAEPTLITTLAHWPSGDTIVGVYPIRTTNDTNPQLFGAGVTYARRYSMQAMLGIAAEDDDGNAAAGLDNRGAAPAKTSAPASGEKKTFAASANKPASDRQKGMIDRLLKEAGYVTATAKAKKVKELAKKPLEDLTSKDASDIIDNLMNNKGAAGDDPETAPF